MIFFGKFLIWFGAIACLLFLLWAAADTLDDIYQALRDAPELLVIGGVIAVVAAGLALWL